MTALALEGTLEPGSADTWDGVDCTLYYGGGEAASAARVRLEQLKYSGSAPNAPWTVANDLLAGICKEDRGRKARIKVEKPRASRATKSRREAELGKFGDLPPRKGLERNAPTAPGPVAT